MEIVTVDGRDPHVFRQFFQVKDAVRREELEFPVGLGLEEARVLMTGDHSDVRADGLGLVDGDTWAGIAWLDWWLLDNTETVEVELAVAPSYPSWCGDAAAGCCDRPRLGRGSAGAVRVERGRRSGDG